MKPNGGASGRPIAHGLALVDAPQETLVEALAGRVSADDVDVWPIDLDVPGLAAAVSPVLPAAELERIVRLRFERDRRRAAAARGATRLILARYLRIPAAEVPLARSPHGKPYIESSVGPSPLRFNLTHSHDQALLAVAHQREVGVDLEWKNEQTEVDSLARRYFCPSEYQILEALSPGARRDAFFRLWTLKEAVMKAVGIGFSLPPDHIEVTLNSGGPSALVRLADGTGDRWCVRELPAGRAYAAGLAVEGFGWQPRWRSCTELDGWPV